MTRADQPTETLLPWVLCGALVLLVAPAVAPAQPPIGSEFQVNTYTSGNESQSAVATNGSGGFVIAWRSRFSAGSDSSYYSVQARRFDSAGTPQGDQFQVNSLTTSWQQYPAVAADAAGNFVVVWENRQDGVGDSDYSIQGQRYDSAGNPQGIQFLVNAYTTSSQIVPSVAMEPDGDFIVVWQSAGGFFALDPDVSIRAHRFNSSGANVGGDFQVNTVTAGIQQFPDVAMGPGGSFVIAWASATSAGTDTSSRSIQARRYDSNGIPLGGDFQVNTYTTGSQIFAEVAVDADGDFVIVWHSDGSAGTDTDAQSVQGQRFASSGVPLGTQFQVNTYTLRIQDFPVVAMDPGGGFVVTWQNVDAGYVPVQGRRYDSSGNPIGDQFAASTSVNTQRPAIAMDAASRFVSVFENFPSSSPDGSSEIFALRFAAPPGPIPVKVAVVKPAKLFKFVAKGDFVLPDQMFDFPTNGGAELILTGLSGGGRSYVLPPDCWKGLGPGGDGSKGFKCKGATCKVTIKQKLIKGVCRDDTGDIALPQSGIGIQLILGTGTTRYCAQCGGTPKGNPDTVFKHKDCAAPLLCP